jgi:hypothetical protein
MIKLLLFVLLVILLINHSNDIENFIDFTDMVEFKRLDDSLIKKFRTNTTYNLYDTDINFLFRNDDVIRVVIPFNHYVKLIYKYKEDDDKKGFAKTIELVEGEHDIKKKYSKDKILDQIIINNIGGRNIYYEPQLYPFMYPRRNYFYPFYSYRTINYPRTWGHSRSHRHY